MKIAVAGGTGVVGRYVVSAARSAGHEVVAMSRSTGVNLKSGDGLAAAMSGVDVVIDASNSSSTKRAPATSFFVQSIANLHRVAQATGVSRLVVLSIVGIDRVPGVGYYDAKVSQERAAVSGTTPVTIVRATQFHEFAGQLLSRMSAGPVALLPSMRIQPVAARTVGEFLVGVASRSPTEAVIEIGGPQPLALVSAGRQTLRRRHDRRIVIPLWIPGAAGRALRGGALLATDATTIAGPAFADWLEGPDFV
ncbi:MAG: SDR family oxidoreductase [Acidimicrobiales bacterium]